MTMARLEVITTVQRRRRWTREDKERIVAASLAPGAVASEVARRAGIHASQLFLWRRQLCPAAAPAPGFAAVTLAPEPLTAAAARRPTAPGLIEIEFAGGTRVRLSGVVDPATAAAVIGALARRP